ncbi:MAG: hypothetical protein Q9180_005525, partial [Flavoplaca navasiana]
LWDKPLPETPGRKTAQGFSTRKALTMSQDRPSKRRKMVSVTHTFRSFQNDFHVALTSRACKQKALEEKTLRDKESILSAGLDTQLDAQSKRGLEADEEAMPYLPVELWILIFGYCAHTSAAVRLAGTCKHANAIWSHFKAAICKTILARTLYHYDKVHSLAKMQENQSLPSDEDISSPDPKRLFSAILKIADEGQECFRSVVASKTFPPAQNFLNIYPNRTKFIPSEVSRFLYVFYRTWQLSIKLEKGGKPLDKLSADDVDKSFFARTSNRELYLLSAVAYDCAYDRDKRRQQTRGLACPMYGHLINNSDHFSRSNPCPWEAAVTVIRETAKQRAKDDGRDCVPGARLRLSAIREGRQHFLGPK